MTTSNTVRSALRELPRIGLLFLAATLWTGCTEAEQTGNEAVQESEEAATELGNTLEGESYGVDLTGAEEVPGPGDEDGTGNAEVRINAEAGEVCYEIEVSGVEPITAAHIHSGAAGASGPPVVNFNVAENGLDGCVSGVSADVIGDIQENPAGYYVNVHNEPHPAGALRGQLAD